MLGAAGGWVRSAWEPGPAVGVVAAVQPAASLRMEAQRPAWLQSAAQLRALEEWQRVAAMVHLAWRG